MSRRMSVAMTIRAVRDRTKTVTRRHVDTWQTLRPGDPLTLIEQGMGLPKGAKQVVVAEVEVTDVRVEPISLLFQDVRYGRQEIALEGFDPHDLEPVEWATWWAGNHGYSIPIRPHSWQPVDPSDLAGIGCRRIEWRYIDGGGSSWEWDGTVDLDWAEQRARLATDDGRATAPEDSHGNGIKGTPS